MKTNLLPYTYVISDIAERIEREIIGEMAAAGKVYLDLQSSHTNGDPIYTFIYDGDSGEFVEEEIVALRIFEDNNTRHLMVLSQPQFRSSKVIWEMEDIVDSWEHDDDGQWNDIFGGDIMGVFTAYNLADALDYIDF